MPIRKHKGINQKTGKLKRGYKYTGKKLKSGLPQIVKIQKGGGVMDKIKGQIEFNKKDGKAYPEKNKIFKSLIKKIEHKDDRERIVKNIPDYLRKELSEFNNIYIEDKNDKFKKVNISSKNNFIKNTLASNDELTIDILRLKLKYDFGKYKIIGKKNGIYIFGKK